MLGARKPKTQRVPVVFEPQLAAEFIGGISSAVNGLLVHKKSSFLGALLGSGSPRPESRCGRRNAGARHRHTAVSMEKASLPAGRGDRGRCPAPVLYDATTARKAKAKSTGSASRAWASLPSIGTSTFI